MTSKDLKKKAIKEIEGVKKELDGRKMSLAELESRVSHLPLFNRVIYNSVKDGILEVIYSNMTLKFLVKSGIIQLDEKVDLWNDDLIGYIGRYTISTLRMECSDGLD